MPSLFTAADTLTRPMRQLLSRYDLSKLWQGDTEERRTNPTMEGFFGPDHYRFALVFNEVKRDEQHPEVYHVRGKCRYRKNIRLFSGFLTVQTVKDLARGNFFLTGPGQDLPDTATAVTYTARARMHLTEEISANSGVFEGESILDFYTNSAPTPIGYVTGSLGIDESMPAMGSGSLLRGKRRNVTTRQVKSFVVSTDDFGVGDRGGQVNPKYAKLGWSEMWENNEWWADPAPVAHL